MKDLNEVISRFSEKWKKSEPGAMVCFQDGHGSVSIDIGRVKYIECVRNTQVLHFHPEDNTKKIYSRMKKLEQELKIHDFLRTHKGYLVNCKFIRRFDAKNLLLTTGEELPIGRSFGHDAKMGYLDYISKTGASYIGKTDIPFREG